jgi:hypothetical protein
MAGEHIKTFAINRSKFRELIHCKGMKVLHSGQDEWQKGKKKKKKGCIINRNSQRGTIVRNLFSHRLDLSKCMSLTVSHTRLVWAVADFPSSVIKLTLKITLIFYSLFFFILKKKTYFIYTSVFDIFFS